jgi:tetratricopeptide (TPR) repeat protein
VPAIAKILLHDEYMDIRAAAAKALGEIGPAAKEAIPALRDPFRASRPQFGGVMENEVLEAARVARAKIGDDAEGLTNRGIKPPPKKPDIEDETKYKELIAKAQRAAEQRQWLKAHAGLEDARVRFARLFSEDAKASKLLEDAGVALALADAHKFLESASLDNAEMAVNKALSIRQTDKEAQGLLETIRNRQVDALVRDAETAGKAGDWEKAVECFQRAARILPSDAKIRAALEKAKSEVQSGRDKALVEQHRDKARKAIEDRNPSGAVEEILAARRILERSDAPWSAPLRETLEMLAKTLVEPLDGDIAKLAESRQYDDARKRVDNALRLQPDSQRLLELRKKIDTLADDPATASVSGTWVSPDGAECELVDHGTDIIGHKATKLPNYITACSGEWKRQGDKLTGRFRVVFARAPQQITEGTVVAKIKNANTLLLYWQDIIWIDRPKTGIWTWRGKGEALWTKPEGK